MTHADPLPTLRAAPARPPGLPLPLDRFVGRDRELSDLRALLGAHRLVTLTGSAGSGKTRLAVELCRRVGSELAGEIVWVDLSERTDPESVGCHVAAALGIEQFGGRPVTELLSDALLDRSVLLALDNCEQAVEGCGSLARVLLERCPELRILATSREPLIVGAERIYPVPLLSLPDPGIPDGSPEALAASEAGRLFVERAQAVLPSFELTDRNAAAVARICRRLDGMPLAIEFAAARVRVLPPGEIAARLDDCFGVLGAGGRAGAARHRTLGTAIDWSYDLLPETERILLERLSVFSGGFTLDAAEVVCAGDGVDAADVLDLLAALVEKSLVGMRERDGRARYALLEVVRQYAAGRLGERGGELGSRTAHAHWCAGFAEAEEACLMRGMPEALDRVGEEQDNVAAALDWCHRAPPETGALDVGLRIGGAFWFFWLYRGRRTEGRRRLEALLGRTEDRGGAYRSRVLHGAGTLAWWLGDPPAARARLEESVAAWRESGDERRLVLALSHLAQAQQETDASELALASGEEAEGLARAAGDPWLLAFTLTMGLGYVRSRRGDFREADAIFSEAEPLWRTLDHPWGLSLALYGRAVGAWQSGDVEAAEAHGRAALRPLLAHGDPAWAARGLQLLAYTAVAAGRFDRAAHLLGAAEGLRESVGASGLAMDEVRIRLALEAIDSALGPEAVAAAWSRGRRMGLAGALAYARGEGSGSEPSAPSAPAEVPAFAEPPAPQRAGPGVAGSGPLPVRIEALGPFRVRRGAEPLDSDALGAGKPRELLLFLLCHPEGRSREEIGASLWPDASPGQVRNSFHVTLHRLRGSLGDRNRIDHADERYRLSDEAGIELDALRFEEEVVRGLRLLRSDEAEEGARRLRDALALYRGDFLEGEVARPWALDLRDRWKQLAVEAERTRAEWLLSLGGRDGEAIEAYRRLLARDDLAEDGYRALMTVHARRGETDEALRLYRQLRVLLRGELNEEPEPATEALARRIGKRLAV